MRPRIRTGGKTGNHRQRKHEQTQKQTAHAGADHDQPSPWRDEHQHAVQRDHDERGEHDGDETGNGIGCNPRQRAASMRPEQG
jgi:hypothetical protein